MISVKINELLKSLLETNMRETSAVDSPLPAKDLSEEVEIVPETGKVMLGEPLLRGSVLVVGVYLADKKNSIEHPPNAGG